MNLIPVGISNRLFYYMNAGENAAFEVRFRFDLKERLDRGKLSTALEKTLASFPEFAVRPVVNENAIWALPNHEPVPLLEDEGQGKILHYGTEETAGYLFAIRCREDGFSFEYFHGMTDFYGLWHFIRTLFYHYALESGLSVKPDDFVRTDPAQGVSEDETERLDPYVRFAPGVGGSAAKKKPEPVDAFSIPEKYYDWEDPWMTGYEIRCPLKALLSMTKERHTSVVPYLSLMAAHTIEESYGTNGKPIHIMASANMRRYYDARTMVNFSDATFLSYDREIASISADEQAIKWREILKEQMTREHFDPIIAQKIKFVQGLSEENIPITEWNRRFTQHPPKADAKSPMTVALTYPGSIDLPEGYRPIIRGIMRWVYYQGMNGFALNATTYGDTMYIRSSQRFDSGAIMEGICAKLKQAGISAEIEQLEKYVGNKILIDRLQHV